MNCESNHGIHYIGKIVGYNKDLSAHASHSSFYHLLSTVNLKKSVKFDF